MNYWNRGVVCLLICFCFLTDHEQGFAERCIHGRLEEIVWNQAADQGGFGIGVLHGNCPPLRCSHNKRGNHTTRCSTGLCALCRNIESQTNTQNEAAFRSLMKRGLKRRFFLFYISKPRHRRSQKCLYSVLKRPKVTRSCPTTISATIRCLSRQRVCSRRCCRCILCTAALSR